MVNNHCVLLNRIETMINKKEDLYGTEFAITNKEEAQALKELCDSLGIESGDWPGCKYNSGVTRGLVSFDLGTDYSCKLIFTRGTKSDDAMDEYKDLRKVDISEITKESKRTKVEYVKCNYSREWKAVRHYNEVGELFVVDCNGNYTNVNDISGAWYEVVCKNYRDLYERIETPVEWWEDAAEFVKPIGHSEIVNGQLLVEAVMTRDQWCDFARILLEQGE
ncbi:hypothetical protein NVP1214O_11 [Vibrio phage 1.214.O._10N.222.54.F11]|nr:hypothetical protein NVP1214O_11 [Vibrio phage 1.214.O._10N.222.54.F11]